MSEFFIILQQLISFLIMLIVGFLAAKLSIASEGFLDGLSKLIVKIVLPLLIFTNGVSGTTRAQLFDSYPIILLSLAMYIGLIVTMSLAGRAMKLETNHRNIFKATMIFGNCGFIGIPLIMSIFPENGALYIALLSIVDQGFMWTYGVKLTAKSSGSGRFDIKKLANPAIVAIVLMLICILGGIHITPWVLTPLSTIGKSATPLSLIYLGGLFHYCDWQLVLKKKEFYIGCVLKLIAFPIAFYLCLSAIFGPLDTIKCVALMAALPTMTAITMLAKINDNEPDYALGSVLTTTAISLATLTLVSYVIF